jgi:type IV pilus assembly protein PilO
VTNRNLIILGALGIVLLIIAYYFLLLNPLLQRLDEQAQARESKQAQLEQVQQQVNELEEVRRQSYRHNPRSLPSSSRCRRSRTPPV